MSYEDHLKSVEEIKSAEEKLKFAAESLMNDKFKKEHHELYVNTIRRIKECYDEKPSLEEAHTCNKKFLHSFKESERIIGMIAAHYEV